MPDLPVYASAITGLQNYPGQAIWPLHVSITQLGSCYTATFLGTCWKEESITPLPWPKKKKETKKEEKDFLKKNWKYQAEELKEDPSGPILQVGGYYCMINLQHNREFKGDLKQLTHINIKIIFWKIQVRK